MHKVLYDLCLLKQGQMHHNISNNQLYLMRMKVLCVSTKVSICFFLARNKSANSIPSDVKKAIPVLFLIS